MPYSPSGAASALVSPRQSHRHARLWWIRRVDGTDLRFTDHDHKLTYSFFDYTPVGGVNPTAIRKQSALEEQNFEVVGVLSSAAITYDDLRSGRYHEAEINEYLVDWLYPWAGPLQHSRYWITETKFDGEQWTAQVSSIPYWLRFQTGDVYSRNCEHDLGDSECTVALGPLQASGSVGTVATDRLTFSVSSLSSTSDGYWADGDLTWLSGPNLGQTQRIRDYTDSSHTVSFYLRAPFTITTGDEFYMTPGCNKTRATCSSKFSNVVNFGGQPFIPGTDKLIQTPTK